MLKEGFLGTEAPLYTDLVLLFEIAMGAALLMGMFLARKKRYRLHACCQSIIVLLNLVIIILVMIPAFRVRVAPKIPMKLGKTYYALATTHAAIGSIAEAGAVYILLAVGTKVLPRLYRLTEYKLWMRSVLVLWWLALLLGLAPYVYGYIR